MPSNIFNGPNLTFSRVNVDKKRLFYLSLLVVFFVPWMVLLPGVAGHITAGDAGELALAGSTLGVAHSPGYPAFALLNKAISGLFYFGNEAYRQNLVSLFFICLVFVLIGVFFVRWSSRPWTVGLALMLLFSPDLRKQALVTEVFPLALFWACLILICAFFLAHRREGFFLLAFLFGIGLSIHQTLMLLAPAVFYFYFKSRQDVKIGWLKGLLFGGLFFLLGWSIHLYLPIRSLADPLLDWEDPETWSRFWGVVTRERYGFLQLAQGEAQRGFSLGPILAALSFTKEKFLDNLGWFGSCFLLVGSLTCLARKEYRRLMVACWILILLTGPFFFWMANVHLFSHETGILDRFILLPLLGAFLILGLGIILLWSSQINIYRVVMGVFIAAFLVEGHFRFPSPIYAEPISAFQTIGAPAKESMRWDLTIREIGMNTLRHLPIPSLLFSDRADEVEFSLAFLLGAENRRSDIQFTDCNAGVTKSLYGDDYYRIWGEPRLRRREKVEGTILSKSRHPVFYATVDPLMINLYRFQWGFLYRAAKLDKIVDPPTTPWQELLSWRFTPRESRSRYLLRSVSDLLGKSLFDSNQFKAAGDMFGLVQKLGGAHRDVALGYLHQKRGQRGKARQAYRRAWDRGSKETALFTNLGELEARYGNFSEAIAIYQKGLNVEPQSVPLLFNLGSVYWKLADWKNVVSQLERVLKIDPDHEQAVRLLPKAKGLLRFAQRRKIRQDAAPVVEKSTTKTSTTSNPPVQPVPEKATVIKATEPANAPLKESEGEKSVEE